MAKIIRRPPTPVIRDAATGMEMQLLFAANETTLPTDAHKSKAKPLRAEETPGKFPLGEIIQLIENCRYLTKDFKVKPVPGAGLRLTRIIEGTIALLGNPTIIMDRAREYAAFLVIKHALFIKKTSGNDLSDKDIELFCDFVKDHTHQAQSKGTWLIAHIAHGIQDILKEVSIQQAETIKRTLVETALQANELRESTMRDIETVFGMDLSCFSSEERQVWIDRALAKMNSPFTDRMGAYGINLLEAITRQTEATERSKLFWDYVKGEGRFTGSGYKYLTEHSMNERGEITETSAADRLHAYKHLVYMAGECFKVKETELSFLKSSNVLLIDRTTIRPEPKPRYIIPAND